MAHPLSEKYGLSEHELLDALDRRFRAKIALEGAVAEVQMEKQIRGIVGNVIAGYESHDVDGQPDFTIRLPDGSALRAECKNVRDSTEAYRRNRQVVAYKVETQKTRPSAADAASRFYDVGYFQVLSVCLGKKTGNWTDFMYCLARDLRVHPNHAGKLAVMQRVPLPGSDDYGKWTTSLATLLKRYG